MVAYDLESRKAAPFMEEERQAAVLEREYFLDVQAVLGEFEEEEVDELDGPAQLDAMAEEPLEAGPEQEVERPEEEVDAQLDAQAEEELSSSGELSAAVPDNQLRDHASPGAASSDSEEVAFFWQQPAKKARS